MLPVQDASLTERFTMWTLFYATGGRPAEAPATWPRQLAACTVDLCSSSGSSGGDSDEDGEADSDAGATQSAVRRQLRFSNRSAGGGSSLPPNQPTEEEAKWQTPSVAVVDLT